MPAAEAFDPEGADKVTRIDCRPALADVVFVLDVDNTRLDGDRIVADLHEPLKTEFDAACAQRFWAI